MRLGTWWRERFGSTGDIWSCVDGASPAMLPALTEFALVGMIALLTVLLRASLTHPTRQRLGGSALAAGRCGIVVAVLVSFLLPELRRSAPGSGLLLPAYFCRNCSSVRPR
ncbi:MAG: hypothetical protein P8L85_24640 [Rubripirellula sp.]|nr:hypothetical protein [Rubripirellula sp.]